MTFEGQYLTYADYINLGGSAIGEMPFNVLEFEARRQIDLRTFNRLKELDSEDIPQEVKMCEYSLINNIYRFSSLADSIANNGNAVSEQIDGYSIQYTGASEIKGIIDSMKTEIDDTIKTYLLNVIVDKKHLLYCGADE